MNGTSKSKGKEEEEEGEEEEKEKEKEEEMAKEMTNDSGPLTVVPECGTGEAFLTVLHSAVSQCTLINNVIINKL